jgi:hypothetical protein
MFLTKQVLIKSLNKIWRNGAMLGAQIFKIKNHKETSESKKP